MTLSGNKIKKYLIIILDSPVGVKTMCPWCEHEYDPAPAIMKPTYKIVRVD